MSRVDDAVRASLALNPMGSIQRLPPIIRSTAAYAPPEVVDGKPPFYLPYPPSNRPLRRTLKEMMQQPAEKTGGKHSFFENGVKSKIGGYIGTACKSLKTVQAKQCSPQKSASAKRKAPYFLRSTVLFWWRIAGSNR